MSEQEKPFDPFLFAPLTSDPKRLKARLLAKRIKPVTQRPAPEPVDPKGDERQPIGVACPNCRCPMSSVIATRPTILGKVWRRRECEHCGHRFTTSERVAKNRPIDISATRPKKKQ